MNDEVSILLIIAVSTALVPTAIANNYRGYAASL
jgi:hypothetical protein